MRHGLARHGMASGSPDISVLYDLNPMSEGNRFLISLLKSEIFTWVLGVSV